MKRPDEPLFPFRSVRHWIRTGTARSEERRYRPAAEVLEGRRLLTVVIAETEVPAETGSIPIDLGDITAGPDGNLWFTGPANVIGRITPQGTITQHSTASTSARSVRATAGRRGGDFLARFAVDRKSASPPRPIVEL